METGKIWEEMRDKIKSSTKKIRKKVVVWRLGRKEWQARNGKRKRGD